jgi:hypothetical protein
MFELSKIDFCKTTRQFAVSTSKNDRHLAYVNREERKNERIEQRISMYIISITVNKGSGQNGCEWRKTLGFEIESETIQGKYISNACNAGGQGTQ